jgi:2-oxoglutarate ferredoxin oxidoreductase subunit alpha
MLADKYQVPVIILTDQHYLDSNYCIAVPDIKYIEPEHYIIETGEDYRRYQFTPDSVSPRGIPGFGKGIVCVDSDEHDEGGYITEDALMRSAMVEKRLNKLKGLAADAIPPTLTGPQTYRHLVVGWGSTLNVVKEALEAINRDDVAFLHFSQVYPLHAETSEILKRAENKIIIEDNATGQFAKLINLKTGIDFNKRILKYDGMPFMLEDVIERIESALKETHDD